MLSSPQAFKYIITAWNVELQPRVWQKCKFGNGQIRPSKLQLKRFLSSLQDEGLIRPIIEDETIRHKNAKFMPATHGLLKVYLLEYISYEMIILLQEVWHRRRMMEYLPRGEHPCLSWWMIISYSQERAEHFDGVLNHRIMISSYSYREKKKKEKEHLLP